ncbi:hypothetical protein E8E13_006658 [Curvularia kusanoi]|uniref:Uncharacterized protein n=1 Tax=Curvularia kusanoi TaxID=90978 RepID=A0A9P4TE36_CURKU|nr:hypothetical protein E8E13_006658 [Curvularia kusanoi]
MGDALSPPAPVIPKPGIMLVRPSLKVRSDENAAIFRRWTTMHFRDLLDCSSPTLSHKGIIRALRYINADGNLFYTIHTDDIAIFKTQPYYEVSRRLDLENTRALRSDEVSVLREGHPFGSKPMIFDVTNAEFGIFEESKGLATDYLEGGSYHNIPAVVLSSSESKLDTPKCVLLTLTCISDGTMDEVPIEQVEHLQESAMDLLCELYGDASRVFPSVYRHVQDAQPDMHPMISKGENGDGDWVVCLLIEGEEYEEARMKLQPRLESLVQEMKQTECEVAWDVVVGLWSGDLFLFK